MPDGEINYALAIAKYLGDEWTVCCHGPGANMMTFGEDAVLNSVFTLHKTVDGGGISPWYAEIKGEDVTVVGKCVNLSDPDSLKKIKEYIIAYDSRGRYE